MSDPKSAVCPACGRVIEIEFGRWTQHTDPKTWGGRPSEVKSCRMARKLYVAKDHP